jgi:hypothetical protein
MRNYTCTADFADARVKPRTVVVAASSRSEARRAARALLTERHPAWSIAQVRAAVTPGVKGEAAAPAEAPEAPALSPEEIRLVDAKTEAAEVATLLVGEANRGSGAWWAEYRKAKAAALARPVVADPAAAIIEGLRTFAGAGA